MKTLRSFNTSANSKEWILQIKIVTRAEKRSRLEKKLDQEAEE